MASYTGHDGTVKFNDTDAGIGGLNPIGNLRNFTIEQTQDVIETTAMGTSNIRTYKPGLSTFTFSGDVFFDESDAIQDKIDDLVTKTGEGSEATFEVYPAGEDSGRRKLSGSMIVTSFSITSSVDGMVEASFAAQGTGALTIGTV
jgi:hypothetical protein|tara:strand:+ start:163 stop:597 length:435 start_codon:yes stop_codon:yes gene_type:complete